MMDDYEAKEARIMGEMETEELHAEIARLSSEGGLKDAAIDRAIVAISTLPEDALGYGYAQNDAYEWPFRDELLEQLREAVSPASDRRAAPRGLKT